VPQVQDDRDASPQAGEPVDEGKDWTTRRESAADSAMKANAIQAATTYLMTGRYCSKRRASPVRAYRSASGSAVRATGQPMSAQRRVA